MVCGDQLEIRFVLTGDISRVLLPPERPGSRRDELWRSTCFEAFVACAEGAYQEFNVAPSSDWAAYDFDSYRHGMRHAATMIPRSSQSRTSQTFRLDLHLMLAEPVTRLGLAAVIEETGGTKSYWALRHPPGKPDFHHPDCFAFALPAPENP